MKAWILLLMLFEVIWKVLSKGNNYLLREFIMDRHTQLQERIYISLVKETLINEAGFMNKVKGFIGMNKGKEQDLEFKKQRLALYQQKVMDSEIMQNLNRIKLMMYQASQYTGDKKLDWRDLKSLEQSVMYLSQDTNIQGITHQAVEKFNFKVGLQYDTGKVNEKYFNEIYQKLQTFISDLEAIKTNLEKEIQQLEQGLNA